MSTPAELNHITHYRDAIAALQSIGQADSERPPLLQRLEYRTLRYLMTMLESKLLTARPVEDSSRIF